MLAIGHGSSRTLSEDVLQERHVWTPTPIPAALDELRRRVQTLPRAGVLAERQVQKRPFEVDVGEEEEVLYAVTELLEGMTLAERITRGRLVWIDAARIGAVSIQIGSAPRTLR